MLIALTGLRFKYDFHFFFYVVGTWDMKAWMMQHG